MNKNECCGDSAESPFPYTPEGGTEDEEKTTLSLLMALALCLSLLPVGVLAEDSCTITYVINDNGQSTYPNVGYNLSMSFNAPEGYELDGMQLKYYNEAGEPSVPYGYESCREICLYCSNSWSGTVVFDAYPGGSHGLYHW